MQIVRPRSVVVGIAAALVLAAWASAGAQMRPSSAEIVRATGRVEILPKGQTAWSPAAVGARLVEGDQVRAMAGAAADLTLPDGSTILIAENTRFAVTKLDYDVANRDRNASFHVVAGKVRAQVSQAAVQLVRARQSNFNISTPNGVAAVRGTIVVTAFNPATQETFAFVFPSPGQSPGSARVTFVNRNGQTVTVTGGNFVRQVGNQPPGAPTPITSLPGNVQAALQTAQNQSTLGANEILVLNVLLPTPDDTQNLANIGLGSPGGFFGLQPVSNPTTPLTGACPGCGQETNPGNNPPPPPPTPSPAPTRPGPTCPPNQEPPCEPTDGRSAAARPPRCASEPCD
jgi:FecR-like protein